MNRRVCLIPFPLMACSGPAIQGGAIVSAGQLPAGDVIASYVPSSCTDAAGAPAQWGSELRLMRNASGKLVLVELRPDQDAVVMDRVAVPGQEYVFQLVVREWLREIRLPASTEGPGKMVVARHWRESSRDGAEVATELGDVVLQCSLAPPAPRGPQAPPSETDSGAAASGGESAARPAPEPSDGRPDPRTGY